MMIRPVAALLLALLPTVLVAQVSPPQFAPPQLPAPQLSAPKLLIVIAVDQFSADLFAEYRGRWTGGMKRLVDGVVFPSGYQSHAATETCPGHATILTGVRPGRAGIIANSWIDQNVARTDKGIYCAEDETKGASSKSGVYVPSALHLRVPTLGDRMKDADPRSRTVAVAGKDRAALMMGGHKTDQVWWLRPTDYTRFETLAGRTDVPAAVGRANAAINDALTRSMPAMPLGRCAAYARPVAIGPTKTVGNGRFARGKGQSALFRASPESDQATLTLAGDLARDLKLGQGPATDLLIVGASATDVVGHAYGTEGSEMCLQLTALDAALGKFFVRLDRAGLDYAVVLTADHGGHDTVERNQIRGIPAAARVDEQLSVEAISNQVAREMTAAFASAVPRPADKPVLLATDPGGDYYVAKDLNDDQRGWVRSRAIALLRAHPQVTDVLTSEVLSIARPATLPPEAWTLEQRARASFTPGVSGDFVVLLKPRITPIPFKRAQTTYIATHGSPWDYDRRVPILFWRNGMAGFEQPNSVETVDIAPTLAAMIGLTVAKTEFDGRCLDVTPGLCR